VLALNALDQIILPLFVVLGVGWIAGRKLLGVNLHPESAQANLRALTRLVFYVFSPCLVFSSLATSEVAIQEIGHIGLFVLLNTATIGVVAWLLARALQLSPTHSSSLLLVAMFANIGNYGLAFNELAFGATALERAVVFFVSSSILLFSVGILIAARAQGKTLLQAIKRVAGVPIVHALLLAGLVRLGWLSIPAPLFKAVGILAQASVPMMLVILGIQLSSVRVHGNWRLIALASAIRLLLAPLVAIFLAGQLGLSGLAEQVSIIQASMPSAVFNIILAVEFNLAVDLTTSVVFMTTVASPATLIPLIAFVR